MELTAFVMDGQRVNIRPAPFERAWMQQTRERFAYRCLPLNIANMHGWEMLLPAGFEAAWNGEDDIPSITLVPDDANVALPAVSHFGHGVLTFHVPCLFRTEPGYDLMVQGPMNRPKDGIAPLTGIVETDWAPYSFTMNWKFTRPTTVRFEKGEPFCHFFPVKRGELESYTPLLRDLSEEPELARRQQVWKESRRDFIADLQKPGSPARDEQWQRHYFRGQDVADGSDAATDHRTRLKLKPFER